MRMPEITEQYKEEWTLLQYSEIDDQLTVLEGTVLAHSADRNEIFKALSRIKGTQLAIEYTGAFPQDLPVCSDIDSFWRLPPDVGDCTRAATRVAIKGPQGICVLTLLIECYPTGCSQCTILPEEVFQPIGYDPHGDREQLDLLAERGLITVPLIPVEWIQVFGQTLQGFKVAAHTSATDPPIVGFVGDDVLDQLRASG